MNTNSEIRTQRLRMRQWQPEDREPFARLNADPEVMRYFPSTLDRTQSDALAQKCAALIHQRGWGFWALEHLGSGEFIGFTGLHIPTDDLPFSPCVEVGWRLAKEYWGKGYASEAAIASLAYGFSELDLKEIVSFTARVNDRSRRVMQRIGMTFNNELFNHPGLAQGSMLREHCLYRISREDWLTEISDSRFPV